MENNLTSAIRSFSQEQMHVYESGERGKPAILFLHGSPLSGQMWLPQLEALGNDLHCLAPDLPGHGLSVSLGSSSIAETCQRLVELIGAAVPAGRAHVVGLSFGGVIAQALLTAAPEVTLHAILSGTAARMGRTMLAILRLYLKLNEPVINLLPPAWLAALFTAQFGVPAQDSKQMGEDVKKVPTKVMTGAILGSYSDIQTPLRAVNPVLVAVGQKETPAARAMARQLTAAIAGSKGVIVPGGGHVWNLQKPALFNATVRAWVNNQPLPAELLPIG